MIPVSTVNANNYNLLGNRLTGESRASRMKRVNALTPYKPSLIERNPGKVHKINPTKPMELGTSHATALNTFVTPSVFSGALAFGLTSLFTDKKAKRTGKGGNVAKSYYASLAATTLSTMVGYGLNNEKVGLLRPNSDNRVGDNYLIGAIAGITPFIAANMGNKNRTKKQAQRDNLNALALGLPGVALSFLSNATFTVPIYLSSLVGVYAARQYYKI